ncbi:AMP-binding protein [Streptomyces sp. WZ-12]|uniref:AMP-binding protein n=1 Tax=Streptomyces sp. WZ-12 TaxID=3030210 RepID=UPI002380C663|nr:AMP-binding protein [Streptomyces sp. WZ-12]
MPSPAFSALDEHARSRPGTPALLYGERTVSYRELTGLADGFRAWLTHYGPAPGTPVCVRAHKSPEVVALILACLLERRPVLLPSAELGAQTLHELVAAAGIRHLLSPGGPDADVTVETVEAHPDAPAVPEGTGLLLTTSGSTGMPKVVPLATDRLAPFFAWASEHFGIGPGTRVLNYAPLNFDLCLLDVWTTLVAGGCVVMVERDHATDGRHLRALVERSGAEVVQAVPMFYRLLHDADPGAGPLEGPRHVIFTGDAMPAKLAAALPRLFPKAALHNVYGCTETNDSLVFDAAPGQLERWDVAVPLPLGRPLPGVRALLIGEDGRELEGPGRGELLVHTPFQTGGYLDPALGRDRFVRRADADGPRTYFRSGDVVVRAADGTLSLAGRADFQVKVRGVRINVQEVEQVISEHPDVAEAVVVALPDEVAGHTLHALVRRAPDTGLHSLALRQHCATRLLRTSIPADIRIVDEDLPKGLTGKVDRAAVKSLRMKGQGQESGQRT